RCLHAQRTVPRAARQLPRPPDGVRVRGQRRRREAGHAARRRRGLRRPVLGSGLARRHLGRFARVDGGNGDSVLPIALLRGAGSGVGRALRALDRAQERARAVPLRPEDRERRRLALRRSGRGPEHPAVAPRGGAALRPRSQPLRHARVGQPLRPRERLLRRHGRRSQVRRQLEPHARRDGQPRFRAGRARSGHRQPHRLRGAARGAAAVFRGGGRHLRVRRRGRGSRQARGPTPVLLLAPYRPVPRGSTTSPNDFVDMPQSSTILGAAKLSGKRANGWSVGVLDAMTAREWATAADATGPSHRDEVEPFRNYFVGRLKRDLRHGNTTVGVIATAVNRNLDTPALAGMSAAAYAGGVDLFHRWHHNTYAVAASLGAPYLRGDTLAL